MKMQDFVIYLESAGCSVHTIRAYTRNVEAMFNFVNKPATDITAMDILNWKNSLVRENKSGSTINQALASVKTYFDFLESIDVISKNPASKIKSPKVENKPKHYISANMIRDMLDATTNVRDFAIVLTFASTGMRVSELSGITYAQYQQMKADGKNYIHIVGKGNKTRRVVLNNDVQMAIDSYIKGFRNCRFVNTDKLFVSRYGGVIHSNNLSQTMKVIARKANIPFADDMCNHALRSACASIMSDNQVPVAVIRDVLGHSSITTTNRYIKTSDSDVETAVYNMKF